MHRLTLSLIAVCIPLFRRDEITWHSDPNFETKQPLRPLKGDSVEKFVRVRRTSENTNFPKRMEQEVKLVASPVRLKVLIKLFGS